MRCRLVLAICVVAALVACGPVDTLKAGVAHSQAVSDNLEKTLGVKAFVGFNGNNGSLNSVNVTFQGIPADMPPTDIVEKSKQAIAAEFKQGPAQVVVSFAGRT